MKKYHYKEQDLQIRCVKWFRVTYPAFAFLMFHPKNEEAGGRERAVRAKKEGVQAGVADLMFMIPTQDYFALAIELKDKDGRMSPQQKIFKRYFEAAGGKYVTVRTFDDFVNEVTKHMDDVTPITWGAVKDVYKAVDEERTAEAKRQLEALIHKQ